MKRRNLVWISVLLTLALFLSLFVLQMGGRMGSVYADAELLPDGRTRIRAGVMSSIGYVRTMDCRIDGEDAYLTFYRTFGLNQPLGAQNEFTVVLPEGVQRIHIWQTGQYRHTHSRTTEGWSAVQP